MSDLFDIFEENRHDDERRLYIGRLLCDDGIMKACCPSIIIIQHRDRRDKLLALGDMVFFVFCFLQYAICKIEMISY